MQIQQALAPHRPIADEALDQLFREARTFRDWLPRPVEERTLREIYELSKLGPTSANASPARFVFITSPASKARLLPALLPLNVEKTKAAPVTVIVAHDTEFYEQLPKLAPHTDMRSYFVGHPTLITETALRNSSLQGAYFILAARSLGLDCGPMSGFDSAKLDAEFFPDGKWKSNFLINLGYGNRSKLLPRQPRLMFEEACQVL